MKNLKNLFSLEGKTVVLTGAGGYIGSRFAEAILEFGAEMLLCVDVSRESLNTLKRRLAQKFDVTSRTDYIVLDQYDHSASEKMFGDTIGVVYKGVDVLINNSYDHLSPRTGFPKGGDTTGKFTTALPEQLIASLDSGCVWPFIATRALGLKCVEMKRRLSVINIGSMYSFVAPDPELYKGTPYYNPPGYSMAKTGLIGLTKYLAAWLAPTVRVNILCPGPIPDPKAAQNQIPKFRKRFSERPLLKRPGSPDDLVGPLIFLASDASAYITGTEIKVEGGWTAV